MKSIFGFSLALLLSVTVFAQQPHFEWAKGIGNTGEDVGYSITTDAAGNIYTTGHFSGTVDFDPGPGVANLTSVSNSYDIFICKMTSSGNLIWAKSVGGNGMDVGYGIAVDAAGNVVTAGTYRNTADFNPGAGTFNITAGDLNGFVCKLDASGNFVWAYDIGGNPLTGAYTDWATHLAIDPSGNIYVTGEAGADCDFDPGAGMTTLGFDGAFLLKLTSSGAFTWVKGFDGADKCYTVRLDASQNIYFTAVIGGLCDFDPGPGIYNLDLTSNNVDLCVVKLDAAGNFVFAKDVGGWVIGMGTCMDLDAQGNIYVAGRFTGTVELDPGPAVLNVTSQGGEDIFVTKLDQAGDLSWTKQFGTFLDEYANAISVDANGNSYITGFGGSNIDFDPGPGSFYSQDPGNAFVLKLDASGNLGWAFNMGAVPGSEGQAILVDHNANVLTTGWFVDAADFDPGPGVFTLPGNGQFNYEIFIHKMSQDPCVNMSLNLDNLAQISCAAPVGSINMSTTGGYPPYNYSWSTGAITSGISIPVPDIYTVIVTDDSACTRSKSYLMEGSGYPSGFDLSVNGVNTSFQAGQTSTIMLDAYNNGCVPVNAVLKLVLPSVVSFSSSIPAPDQVSGDTLSWNLTGITYDVAHFTPVIEVTPDTTLTVLDTLCLMAIIEPQTGDADTTNNIRNWCTPVVGSYDPNMIAVYPGECSEHYVLPSEMLTYTINFQNTGTANAINIHVVDSLDAHLDLITVKVVGSSHPVITEVLPGNKLNFVFNNIQLPDSNTSEPLSHGYVIYQVQQIPGNPDGTVIGNKADIYFDYNPAVITNTVTNTVISTIPFCHPTAVAGVSEPGQAVTVFPNPAIGTINITTGHKLQGGSLRLRDMTGRILIQRTNLNGDHFIMDLRSFPAGIYSLELIENHHLAPIRIIKN